MHFLHKMQKTMCCKNVLFQTMVGNIRRQMQWTKQRAAHLQVPTGDAGGVVPGTQLLQAPPLQGLLRLQGGGEDGGPKKAKKKTFKSSWVGISWPIFGGPSPLGIGSHLASENPDIWTQPPNCQPPNCRSTPFRSWAWRVAQILTF